MASNKKTIKALKLRIIKELEKEDFDYVYAGRMCKLIENLKHECESYEVMCNNKYILMKIIRSSQKDDNK